MLTVAIPTYNRAEEMSALLDSVVSQIPDVDRGFVNVLVSDNASSDNTEEVVRRYMPKFSNLGADLLYRRNEQNTGFSPNVDRAICHSPDEFVLVMGDDDGLELGALVFLQGILKRHKELDVFFLSSRTYSADLVTPVDARQNTSISQGNERTGEHAVIFADGVEYIRVHRGYPPALVSGYVFRKSAWEKVSASDFYDSISIHMLVATRILLRHGRVGESIIPHVKYRSSQANSTWSRDPLYPFRFYLDELKACRSFKEDADGGVFRILCRVPLRSLAFYLVRQKVTGHPFHRELFWEHYNRSVCCCNIYTFLIGATRFLPRWMLMSVICLTGSRRMISSEL